eukprot:Skav206197  [mRNA]  locus=scaffold1844:330345:331501:- [translate_table: standard]
MLRPWRSTTRVASRCFAALRRNTPAAPLSNWTVPPAVAEMIRKMRQSCGLAAEALALACEVAKAGVTTDEALHGFHSSGTTVASNQKLPLVDRRTSEFVISRGAYPVGINYYGFPRGLCASPNEVALHGVPNTRPLEEGDAAVRHQTSVFTGARVWGYSGYQCS